MTVTRMVLHNLLARTLRAGLRAGEVTATTLRVAGCASLTGILVVHAIPAAVALGAGGAASLTASAWLGHRLSKWRDAADWQPGPGPAPKRDRKRDATRSPGRRRETEAGEIAPGSVVEVVGARPGERGTWQVLTPVPTKGRGRAGAAYLVERPRTRSGSGKPRVIDAARLVVVAPPPPAARPLAAALARGRGNGSGRDKRGVVVPDPTGRADTLQGRAAALQANAQTNRRRAAATTAAATRARHRAERNAERNAAERARQPDQHRDRPTTRTRT